MTIKTDLLKQCLCDIICGNILDFEIDENYVADTMAIIALSEIQRIIRCEESSDFQKVEEIVRVFEKYNIDAGVCHDF